MTVRTFDRIEDATEWLNSESFAYPTEISSHHGRDVLKMFKLTPEGTARFRQMLKNYDRASWREVSKSAAKTYGPDAVNAFAHAIKGRVFSFLVSYVSLAEKVGNSDFGTEERLAKQDPNHDVYQKFERAFISRELFVYKYMKTSFPMRKARIANRKIEYSDDCALFLYRL